MEMDIPVEAEVKYEISEEQYSHLSELLLGAGFVKDKVMTHEDHYTEHTKSELGGFNFVRVRKQTGEDGRVEYLWNKKTHALDSSGNKIRLEQPGDLSEAEYGNLVAKASINHPIIIKNRQDFIGKIQNWPATVSVDSICIGGVQKYFIEVEIITDPFSGHTAREACKTWAKDVLHIEAKEADGYLNQYLSIIDVL